MRLIDTHCHLNFKAFKADFLSVAKKSANKGIEKAIIVGSNETSSKNAIEIAEKINNELKKKWAYVAVGIHPTHYENIKYFNLIEKLARDKLVVAVGETGFDFFRTDRNSLSKQKELFQLHLELANKLNKPLILHNRKADEYFMTLLDSIGGCRAVFHCFSSDYNFAQEVIKRGIMISFTGNITYGNKMLKKVIRRTPMDRIMVETDAPYIVPEPWRSTGISRNEPYLVSEIVNKIAKEKDLSIDEVATQTTQNAIEFFGL